MKLIKGCQAIAVFHQNETSQTLSSYNYQEYIDLLQTEK